MIFIEMVNKSVWMELRLLSDRFVAKITENLHFARAEGFPIDSWILAMNKNSDIFTSL